ncbi:MAG: beta-lactamase family protein [Candidatus Bathyarchaeota archaeon]|nr:MAG: beta-lactamase family protein [Candidatus Bathyarchaeota archaeon]
MVENERIPSLAIAVVRKGRILWEEAFGYEDIKKGIKASPFTIYPVASISKSLTATGVMTLIQRGLLDLDDPIEKHITPTELTVYEGHASAVTVRRVLNMTAGIPNGYKVCRSMEVYPSLQSFIPSYSFTAFPPGERELYSNFAYAILELLIETLSGLSFTDFMTQEVFNPLRLVQTSVGAPSIEKNVAMKYGTGFTLIPHNYFIPAAAGGIYSSIHDLIRYGLFHLGSQLPTQTPILDRKTLTTMHMVKDTNLQHTIMALGWGSIDIGDEIVWLISNGSIEGATSMLSLVPSEDLAVACLTNMTSQSSIADQVAIEVTDALLPKFADRVATFMQRYEQASSFKSFQASPLFNGMWEGKIKTHRDKVLIRIVFHTDGPISIRLDKGKNQLLRNVRIRDHELEGDFRGRLPNSKNLQGDHTIDLHLKIRGNGISGVATTRIGTDQDYAMLPYYIRLIRK